MTNTEADRLSRKADPTDWEVTDAGVRVIEHKFGPHSVDRMAARINSKLARFNSRLHDPAAEAVNCFSQDWAGENNYVVPPFGLIPAVLRHVIECRAEATIVAPIWPSAWWWGLLSRLSTAPPLPLPRASFLVGPSAGRSRSGIRGGALPPSGLPDPRLLAAVSRRRVGSRHGGAHQLAAAQHAQALQRLPGAL